MLHCHHCVIIVISFSIVNASVLLHGFCYCCLFLNLKKWCIFYKCQIKGMFCTFSSFSFFFSAGRITNRRILCEQPLFYCMHRVLVGIQYLELSIQPQLLDIIERVFKPRAEFDSNISNIANITIRDNKICFRYAIHIWCLLRLSLSPITWKHIWIWKNTFQMKCWIVLVIDLN